MTGNEAVARSGLWTPSAHLGRAAAPDLIALAGKHLAAGSANAEGGPPAFLLKLVGAIAGVTQLMRLATDRLYRAGLRKEGYDDGAKGAGMENRLRQVSVTEVRRETPTHAIVAGSYE
ncbi:hypothetical protein HFP71_33255 [Streptomyces sp. ARC32]